MRLLNTKMSHTYGVNQIDDEPENDQRFYKSKWFKEFLAEILGTFMLIVIGNGAVAYYVLSGQNSDPFVISLCFGVGAMIGICATSSISGAHLNPAVTTSLAYLNKFSWRKVPLYIIAQHIGAFLAAAIVYLNFYEAINAYDHGTRSAYGNSTSTGGIFATYPAQHVSISGALIDQVIGTCILMIAILSITDDDSKIPQYLHPLLLALTITGICVAYGLNCGAILNPARDFAPRLFTSIAGYGIEPFRPLDFYYWIIAGIIGPHIGGIIGAITFRFMIIHKSDKQMTDYNSIKMRQKMKRDTMCSNGSSDQYQSQSFRHEKECQKIIIEDDDVKGRVSHSQRSKVSSFKTYENADVKALNVNSRDSQIISENDDSSVIYSNIIPLKEQFKYNYSAPKSASTITNNEIIDKDNNEMLNNGPFRRSSVS